MSLKWGKRRNFVARPTFRVMRQSWSEYKRRVKFLFSHRDFDTLRNLIYMSYLGWYDAKFIKKSWSFQNRCVFPLFSRKEKSATWISSKLLIFKVDQPGLEPGTSRLWVCCSNQLSYKSDLCPYGISLRVQRYCFLVETPNFWDKNMQKHEFSLLLQPHTWDIYTTYLSPYYWQWL